MYDAEDKRRKSARHGDVGGRKEKEAKKSREKEKKKRGGGREGNYEARARARRFRVIVHGNGKLSYG